MGRITTGWPEFDREFGGLPRPGVITIGSTGTCASRTLTELLILARAAVGHGGIIFIQRVPPRQEYLDWMACFRAGLEPVHHWTTTREGTNKLLSTQTRRVLAAEEQALFEQALSWLADAPVVVDDSFPNSLAGIAEATAAAVREHRTELAAVHWSAFLDEAPELPERGFYRELVESLGRLAVDVDTTFVLACPDPRLPGSSMELRGHLIRDDTLDLDVFTRGRFGRCTVPLAPEVRTFLARSKRDGLRTLRQEEHHVDYF